jgi:hypothetical protein
MYRSNIGIVLRFSSTPAATCCFRTRRDLNDFAVCSEPVVSQLQFTLFDSVTQFNRQTNHAKTAILRGGKGICAECGAVLLPGNASTGWNYFRFASA